MGRYLVLLMAGFVVVFSLNSCATPEIQKVHGVSMIDMGNGVCRQLPSGLMWQIEQSELISTYEKADEYVKKLQLAGFDDWRLPTRDECLYMTELQLMKKGDCPIKKSTKGYWVSSGQKGKPGFWDDYQLCAGPEFRWVKSKEGYVRAVRP